MTREEIQAKVIELAAEHGGIAPTDVTPASHFANDLGYDSLEDVEFAMDVEDEFGISIPDEKIERVKTVGDAIELVLEHAK